MINIKKLMTDKIILNLVSIKASGHNHRKFT